MSVPTFMAILRRCRVLLCLFLTCPWIFNAGRADAYGSEEHKVLSDLALEIALEMRQAALGESQRQQLRALLLGCGDCTVDERLRALKRVDFGQLAASPDSLFHPERMVKADGQIAAPSPPRCGKGALAAPSDFVPSFANDSQVYQATQDRLQIKLRRRVNRLLALHQNVAHFEACAADQYNQLHGLAMERAASRRDKEGLGLLVPLLTEAIALHFLQDSFPPGHYLTPRTHTPDLIARSMHQYNNRVGETVAATDSPVLSEILAALESTTAGRPHLDKFHISPSEVVALRQRLPASVEFHGDDAFIRKGVVWPQGPSGKDEFLLMVVATTRSILDVLDAGLPATAGIQEGKTRLDFQPWRAPADPEYTSLITPDDKRLERPRLNLRWGKLTQEGAIFGYQGGAQKDVDRFGDLKPEVTASFLYGEGGAASLGERVELGFVGGLPGSGDIENLDSPTKEPFTDWLGFIQGFSDSLQGSFERWTDYRAYGVSILALPLVTRTSKIHANFYMGVELGMKRYESTGVQTDRFFWGGRAGLGIAILFLDFGFQNGHRIDPSGKVREGRAYSLGVRAHLIR